MTATSSNSASALARTTGWITLGALLALAPQLVACEDTEHAVDNSHSPAAAPIAAAPQEETTQVPKPEAKGSLKADDLPAENSTDSKKGDEAKTSPKVERAQSEVSAAEDGQPFVKRLVIASAVQEREPVELEEGKVSEPILAFLELKNIGESESGVVVTFEHESGKKVGFVELSVPAESNRYRTWARTRNIQESGTWTAIVQSKTGEELARKSFTVAG